MIRIGVKFFGPLRDIVGVDETQMSVASPCTGEAAFEQLSAKHPAIKAWRSTVKVAVNLEYVEFHRVLHDGDELCFIPPVSGG